MISAIPDQAWKRMWRMRFRVLEAPEHLPRPFKLQRHITEQRGTMFYNRQRRHREPTAMASLRLTLGGVGWYDHGGERHRVEPGNAILAYGADDGWGMAADSHDPWEWFACEFLGAGSLVAELQQRLPPVFPCTIDDELLRPLTRYRRYNGRSVSLGHHAAARLVIDLLGGLSQRLVEQSVDADRRLIAAAWDLIDRYAPGGLAVADLAARLGVTAAHLARVFRRGEGITPQEAILRARMQRAARQLTGGRLPVKAVASELGYATPSHFARAFKRVFGVTPAQFRRTGLEAWLP